MGVLDINHVGLSNMETLVTPRLDVPLACHIICAGSAARGLGEATKVAEVSQPGGPSNQRKQQPVVDAR